ncbi:MAG TPA: aminopeptidase [Phycisphaerae bacterium]|nr:aminopeptidase [Phycisphaerae bacterium]HOJ74920.1 aminopeptidase [Phycisphaerae bacterium]HOM51481.1 aminopeptidase [Phycisphaerae bacterium]HON67577.1 aminopeptidase [Phycisphaerae bacterium]HOQ85595.1 aminopeptidase [Phycisphaerae bacterium]
MLRKPVKRTGGLITVVLLAGLTGCGADAWSWNYAIGAFLGELEYLSRAVPIEQGLEDPELTQEQKDRLEFVIRVRDYAESVIGLNVGDSFRQFVNLRGERLAWNLSASRKDALEPYLWNVPVAGEMPYLGFFKEAEALAERDRLVAAGYDTFLYELDAFSTLGVMPDPVASTLLERPLPSLADTVVHELLHNTIWKTGHAVFNESLATFVGRTGSMEFLAFEFGQDSDLLAEAQQLHENSDRIDAFLKQLAAEVEALYAQDIPSEDKIAQREAIFEAARQRFKTEVQPLLHNPEAYSGYGTLNYNNAFLLVNVRYNSELDLFADVYESTGRSWSASLEIFRQAAAASDPYAFLRTYLQTLAVPAAE